MQTILNEIVAFWPSVLFNLYFAAASVPFGFVFAVVLALGKASPNPWISRLSRGYIYAFRGSPLFIQFFMFYSLALSRDISPG
jgi:His/Glu/Gln/Arg/opine family amino acid ABC transporter permease subunit